MGSVQCAFARRRLFQSGHGFVIVALSAEDRSRVEKRKHPQGMGPGELAFDALAGLLVQFQSPRIITQLGAKHGHPIHCRRVERETQRFYITAIQRSLG